MFFGDLKKQDFFLVNNSPHPFHYKVEFEVSFEDDNDRLLQIVTPHSLGIEKDNRIISCIPERGVVMPYSKFPITILCRCKIEEECKIWTSNYA